MPKRIYSCVGGCLAMIGLSAFDAPRFASAVTYNAANDFASTVTSATAANPFISSDGVTWIYGHSDRPAAGSTTFQNNTPLTFSPHPTLTGNAGGRTASTFLFGNPAASSSGNSLIGAIASGAATSLDFSNSNYNGYDNVDSTGGTTTTTNTGDVTARQGEILLIPRGPLGQGTGSASWATTAAFTAPAAGIYTITANFYGADTRGTAVNTYVFDLASTAATATQLDAGSISGYGDGLTASVGTSPTHGYIGVLSLAKNEIIAVGVAPPATGATSSFEATAVSFSISTPEPASLGLIAVGAAGLLARRGRRRG